MEKLHIWYMRFEYQIQALKIKLGRLKENVKFQEHSGHIWLPAARRGGGTGEGERILGELEISE